jgi:hypothetical protein
MESLNKLKIVNVTQLNKSNTFIEVNSPVWRNSNKISIEDLSNDIQNFEISNVIDNETIKIDPSTLKIKVADIFKNTSNVFHEHFNSNMVSFSIPPKNASEITGLHMMSDSNYLYIWVGNRWKRIALKEW